MVADSCKEHFIAFYDHFVPLLKQIIVQAVGKEDRFFRGRAMECLTLIGTSGTRAQCVSLSVCATAIDGSLASILANFHSCVPHKTTRDSNKY